MPEPPDALPPEGPEQTAGPGQLAMAAAGASWIATFVLLFLLAPFISGYRGQGGGKVLGLLLVLAPAVVTIALGVASTRRGRSANDRGAVAQGSLAITSGVILLPVALIAFWWAIVRV